MAGDWLKVEKDTPVKPEVVAIAGALGISTDEAFAKCFRFWAWADSHTLDGTIRNVTATWVDSFVGAAGFATALEKVSWLRLRSDGIELPNFGKHCGAPAKARAADALRKRTSRASRARPENVRSQTGQNPDQRREEIEESKDSSPAKERRRSETPHHRAIAIFCEAWQAKYGTKYPFAHGKDGEAVRWMLCEIGGDLDRWKEVVLAYLSGGDKFAVEDRHGLALLRSQLRKYLPVQKVTPKAGAASELARERERVRQEKESASRKTLKELRVEVGDDGERL